MSGDPSAELALLCVSCLVCITFVSGRFNPMICSNPSPSSQCQALIYLPDSLVSSTSNDIIAHRYNSSSPNYIPNIGYLVQVECACYTLQDIQAYFALTSYLVTPADAGSGLDQISNAYFQGLAWNESGRAVPIVNKSLEIHLGCGCLQSGFFKSVISYVVQQGDIVADIATRFQSSASEIARVNNVPNISNIQIGQVLFIPSSISPSSVNPAPEKGKKNYLPLELAVGIGISVAIVLALIIITIRTITTRHRKYDSQQKRNSKGGFSMEDVEYNAHTAFKGSGSSQRNLLGSWSTLFRCPGTFNSNTECTIKLPGDGKSFLESEKPIVFTYNEIMEASANFLEARKLGEGAFGAVYHGYLRNQEVAIKKMKASKSREFIAELKVLCKVHHTNLVELIGYAVGEEELYLVYELVENGALSERLHDPVKRGYQPLSWTERVQIALDAARGLEYIHEHTRNHYVHRDVKTSNILLDGLFRAKVGDFGLAKLVEQAGESENHTTRLVGTVGYLAPDYIRDGQVTSKSDVYAFGVVLMELITGLEALAKSKSTNDNRPTDQRSLVSLLYAMSYKGELDFQMLQEYVDANLQQNYPEGGLYKMAELARACVDEDSMVRPDMREVVFKLSQILLTSIEWEATLAGNSQIFSGLIQGR